MQSRFLLSEGEYFYELLPGFITAIICVIIVTLLTEKPGEKIMTAMDEVRAEIRS